MLTYGRHQDHEAEPRSGTRVLVRAQAANRLHDTRRKPRRRDSLGTASGRRVVCPIREGVVPDRVRWYAQVKSERHDAQFSAARVVEWDELLAVDLRSSTVSALRQVCRRRGGAESTGEMWSE